MVSKNTTQRERIDADRSRNRIPPLKSVPTRRELVDLYTPTKGELELAARSSKGEPARLAFLVLLKTFQRLGYFIALRDVPRGIVEHIGHDRGMLVVPEVADYDDSGTRRRHVKIISQYLRVKSFDETGQVVLAALVETPPIDQYSRHLSGLAAALKNELDRGGEDALQAIVSTMKKTPKFTDGAFVQGEH